MPADSAKVPNVPQAVEPESTPTPAAHRKAQPAAPRRNPWRRWPTQLPGPPAAAPDRLAPELSLPPDPQEANPEEWQERGASHAGYYRHDKRHKLYALEFNRAEISHLLYFFEQAVQGRPEGFDWIRRAVLLREVIERRAMQAGYTT